MKLLKILTEQPIVVNTYKEWKIYPSDNPYADKNEFVAVHRDYDADLDNGEMYGTHPIFYGSKEELITQIEDWYSEGEVAEESVVKGKLPKLKYTDQKTTIGDLEFGKNIFKYTNLPLKGRDEQRRVIGPRDLEDWKKDKDPNMEVTIRTDEYDRVNVIVPSFEDGIEKVRKGKEKWLDQERQKGVKYTG